MNIVFLVWVIVLFLECYQCYLLLLCLGLVTVLVLVQVKGEVNSWI